MVYCLDTSTILSDKMNLFENIYISPLVLMELENIKGNSAKSEHVKFLARKAVREIISREDIYVTNFSQKRIARTLKKYDFLMDIPDHHILCDALLLAQTAQVKFVTSDAALYTFAQYFPQLNAIYLEQEEKHEEVEYCGWSKYYPTEEQMAALYTDSSVNILGAKTNEYCEIFEEDQLKDILFWDGHKYRNLNYKTIKNKFLGETLKPLNIEQKMAFDLLQNRDITVKLFQGAPGTGKDLLMIHHALDLIQNGEMDKIIFIRNLVPFKDAPEIGFIKGTLQEKLEWGLGPLSSLLGEEALMMYEENGTIEAMNLGFIRGCSWDRTILYVSEGQNITGGGYKLLVSRCGKGSEMWVNGDILQTDSKKFEKNNGIQRLITSLSGNELFGTVKLLKTERSKTAELASII